MNFTNVYITFMLMLLTTLNKSTATDQGSEDDYYKSKRGLAIGVANYGVGAPYYPAPVGAAVIAPHAALYSHAFKQPYYTAYAPFAAGFYARPALASSAPAYPAYPAHVPASAYAPAPAPASPAYAAGYAPAAARLPAGYNVYG